MVFPQAGLLKPQETWGQYKTSVNQSVQLNHKGHERVPRSRKGSETWGTPSCKSYWKTNEF